MRSAGKIFKAFLESGIILSFVFAFVAQARAQSCIPPSPGLVSWWPGDGNAQDIQNGNDGTLQGGATFAQGMVGLAFNFDGINDFVQVPDSPSLNIGTTDFSLDAWVKTTYPDLQTIMDKRVTAVSGLRLGYHFYTGGLGLGFQMGNGASEHNYDSFVFINDGHFHHVAVTVSRGSRTGGKLFVDGAVVLVFDPTLYPGNLDNTADFRIGGHIWAPAYGWHGLIDEMDFFKRALTDDEVLAIFKAGRTGKCQDTEVNELQIDIKPGNYWNCINPESKGMIPVAILTTNTFDATTVDPLSVRFGPNGAFAVHEKRYTKDANKDKKKDLVLQFRIQETGIRVGDTMASLTGETFDGQAIEGSGSIRTVECK